MDERFTNFYVDYNIEDTTAKQDASFSSSDLQQQTTNIGRLIYLNKEVELPYFTFEHNFNVLDGTLTEMPIDPDNQYVFFNNTFNQNSILFEESTNGTVTANSTSAVPIEHSVANYTKSVSLSAGTWYISGCPKGGGASSYSIVVNNSLVDTGDGVIISLNSASTITVSVRVAADFFAEELIFRPVVSAKEGPYQTTIIPYYTKNLSNIDGEYTNNNPTVTINFTREHASAAFVMQFVDDHPLEAQLSFYNLDNEILLRHTVEITSNKMLVTHDVFGYAKIIIEFTKTLPNRYIKFKNFYFGVIITWDETNVKEANVVQEVDRMSKNLSIDTLSFKVIDVTSDLNLGNLDGLHKYFQKNQYMLPYEIIQDYENGYPLGPARTIKLGKYYLKTFSENSNLGKMTAQSYLGIMDENQFFEGEVYNGKIAGEVIEQIFEVCGCTDYEIDNDTYNQPLYGTITPKSCRKALQEVLFACNSVINAHDLNKIIIKKTGHIRRPDVPRNSKFSTAVTKNNYTYGVEVKYNSYTLDADAKEIAKGEYTPGNYTIQFNEPFSNVSITGGTITKARPYYVEFTVSTGQEVTITGKGYTKVQNTVKATQIKIKPGEEERFVTYNTNLCNQETGKLLAQNLLTYLDLDLTLKMKWLADNNDMNDFHVVENPDEEFNDYSGVFIKRSIDLSGGFIDTATMAAKSILDDYYKYTRIVPGPELYTGEEGND